MAGHTIWADEINKAGGVCGRQIELDVRDHGSAAETAKVQYADLEPKVVGFPELFGASTIAALYRDLINRQSSAVALSYSSELLSNPYVLIAGTTYDVEMINGLNYLMSKGMLKKGDTLEHICIGGQYGNNGLLGSEYSRRSTASS